MTALTVQGRTRRARPRVPAPGGSPISVAAVQLQIQIFRQPQSCGGDWKRLSAEKRADQSPSRAVLNGEAK